MKSILEAMYGGGDGSKPVKPSSGSGYYSSFGYYDDLKKNNPPPTADKSGPTALELAQNYGYADEQGMLSNGMHATVAAMYGGGMAPINAGNNSMNPAYGAALQGDTMGGIGNTDAWGQDIFWSTPDPNKGTYGTLADGDTFQTPAGDYQVSKNPWGQYVLVPQDGAIQTNAPYVTNFTHGPHHIGINPETGEVWYQKAAGYYNYSGGGDSYTQVEGAPIAPNAPGGGGGNNGGNGGGNSVNSGMSWQEVLANTALADQLRVAAQKSGIDNQGLTEGLFKSLSRADSYAQMLKNLGLRG